VYFGAESFNARIGAENFSDKALALAFEKCHAWGVKSYVTLNTLALDREMSDYLETARRVWSLGADALIVADIGGASAIKRYYPEIELHGSTQLSGHNVMQARLLSDMGFSRMVLARETPYQSIKEFVENSPIEAEIFIHGALCVSHSGQCLFSSIVGGRSGNRGECAQPCRLPYSGKDNYPLSLRDLCLAPHIPDIIDSGAASLKIEGRMKSPEYVHEVVKVYRTLLDERRGADSHEMKYLTSVFSRGGFTDAYFTGNIGRTMLGRRSEEDKSQSRALQSFDRINRTLPITLKASFSEGSPSILTLSTEDRSVSVTGDAPFGAVNVPMTRESVLASLSKLGGTPYRVEKADIEINGSIMLPVSKINDLRRRAADALIGSPIRTLDEKKYSLPKTERGQTERRSARFVSEDQISDEAVRCFERRYLPLHRYSERANGVILPPVIFDGEYDKVHRMLACAAERGAKYALCTNLGQLEMIKEFSLTAVGDFRLNIFNRESGILLGKLGFESFIASPELTMPQIRDLGADAGVIVYGRLPLMLLEKCVIKEVSGCDECERGKAHLTDRKGIDFPVMREWEHRNVVYNSLPTYMGDRKSLLLKYGIKDCHFIFSTETRSQVSRVTDDYEKGVFLDAVRRIKE
ncbi:MAG: U32 family peptidase, partial [Clostridia bacterium]|nr:U32 family peptidase [Clostridia bacterium]